MVSPRLLLYSTDHCALCDAALDLLLSMPELGGLPLDVVDISTDEALIAAYGEHLPVLALATAPAHNESAAAHNESAAAHNESAAAHNESAAVHNESGASHNEPGAAHKAPAAAYKAPAATYKAPAAAHQQPAAQARPTQTTLYWPFAASDVSRWIAQLK